MYLLEQSLIKGIKLILDDLGFDHLHVFARAKFGKHTKLVLDDLGLDHLYTFARSKFSFFSPPLRQMLQDVL
jgi:DNA-directed RNA polymerase subunit N (RpoN/RPB10)